MVALVCDSKSSITGVERIHEFFKRMKRLAEEKNNLGHANYAGNYQ